MLIPILRIESPGIVRRAADPRSAGAAAALPAPGPNLIRDILDATGTAADEKLGLVEALFAHDSGGGE
jgi:hypothetical protein